MEGFLNSNIITLNRPWCHHIDMKAIGKSIMTNIMADSSNDHG
jgi:hypothetical protein